MIITSKFRFIVMNSISNSVGVNMNMNQSIDFIGDLNAYLNLYEYWIIWSDYSGKRKRLIVVGADYEE